MSSTIVTGKKPNLCQVLGCGKEALYNFIALHNDGSADECRVCESHIAHGILFEQDMALKNSTIELRQKIERWRERFEPYGSGFVGQLRGREKHMRFMVGIDDSDDFIDRVDGEASFVTTAFLAGALIGGLIGAIIASQIII